MRTSPRMHVVAVVAATGALLAACGGDDPETSAAVPPVEADTSLTVVAEDIDFDRDAYATTPGNVGVIYENQGRMRHSLVVEDVDGFRLQVTAHGDLDEGTIELEPGEYVLFCDIAGHRSGGMVATLDVTS